MDQNRCSKIIDYIVDWLSVYSKKSGLSGFIVGVSGGVDSALVSMLCAKTGIKTLLVDMPILQKESEHTRALDFIQNCSSSFENVSSISTDLTDVFLNFKEAMPEKTHSHDLSMANSRARLRMMTLYAMGQSNDLLVVGTGNKVEDFGVGFFTKYGDGGVDISPIADLLKTEVYQLAKFIGVDKAIIEALPTDGLWEDERNDEAQIGATYKELEFAMNFDGIEETLNPREKEVLSIYRDFHRKNLHKMQPIPICKLDRIRNS